jgi:hypothetical protein
MKTKSTTYIYERFSSSRAARIPRNSRYAVTL